MDCGGKCSYKEYGETIFTKCCDRCAAMDGQEVKAHGGRTLVYFTNCIGCEHDDEKENNPSPNLLESMAQATTCYHWQPYKSIESWPEKMTEKGQSWYAYGFTRTSETVKYVNASRKFGCVADRVDSWLADQVERQKESRLQTRREGFKATKTSVDRHLGEVTSHDGIFEVSCAAADKNHRKQTKAFNLKEVDCNPCGDVPKLLDACCMDCANMAAEAD
eukprot:TRINITY_DN35985_c0_g1_i1.p1 TRINITY_DN35985_c0_g1~~TRINITY_DN35985_c0_g1_i1.p1  ORF type:complete len:219 (+),score=27.38 TRINITY_DN35985_c0_g1_i1:407-1063(+)